MTSIFGQPVVKLGAAPALFVAIFLLLAACSSDTARQDSVSPAMRGVIEGPRYTESTWGVLVVDRATGETLYSLNPGRLFGAASTTKLFTTATALDTFGADFRFQTKVRSNGPLLSGVLNGDLILVASGDLTMGGRTTADGRIDFTDLDHGNANSIGLATLTPEDPLAGLNELARQVAASGISRISGEVIIDDRLFPTMPVQSGDYLLTPIVINDNLIDITVDPTAAGNAAVIDWRPKSAMVAVTNNVQTVAAGQPTTLDIRTTLSGNQMQITVAGQVAAGGGQAVRTVQVAAPATFSRTLFIEALQRNGITVDAVPLAANPTGLLPARQLTAALPQVANLVSPPMSEHIKLVQKVSLNLHADTLMPLIALANGGQPSFAEGPFEEGLQVEKAFLTRAGLDVGSISLADGRGGLEADLLTPKVVVQLLRHMETRPDFAAYLNALPILGVDGSLASTVAPDSPVRGKVKAKTGTTAVGDLLNQRPISRVHGLAGYMTTSRGRELAIVFYVNNVLTATVADIIAVAKDLGTLCEIVYLEN